MRAVPRRPRADGAPRAGGLRPRLAGGEPGAALAVGARRTSRACAATRSPACCRTRPRRAPRCRAARATPRGLAVAGGAARRTERAQAGGLHRLPRRARRAAGEGRWSAGRARSTLSARCVACHASREFAPGDVHKGQVSCAACHGAHMIQPVRDPATHGIAIGIARRCAVCHDSVATLEFSDVHGATARAQAAMRGPIGRRHGADVRLLPRRARDAAGPRAGPRGGAGGPLRLVPQARGRDVRRHLPRPGDAAGRLPRGAVQRLPRLAPDLPLERPARDDGAAEPGGDLRALPRLGGAAELRVLPRAPAAAGPPRQRLRSSAPGC